LAVSVPVRICPFILVPVGFAQAILHILVAFWDPSADDIEFDDTMKEQTIMSTVSLPPFFFRASSLYNMMPHEIADGAAVLIRSKQFAGFQATALFSKASSLQLQSSPFSNWRPLGPLRDTFDGSFHLYRFFVFGVAVAVAVYAMLHALAIPYIDRVEWYLALGMLAYNIFGRHANLIALLWCGANVALLQEWHKKLTTGHCLLVLLLLISMAVWTWLADGSLMIEAPPSPPGAPLPPTPPTPPRIPPLPDWMIWQSYWRLPYWIHAPLLTCEYVLVVVLLVYMCYIIGNNNIGYLVPGLIFDTILGVFYAMSKDVCLGVFGREWQRSLHDLCVVISSPTR
jgi:hypothetical protein